MKENVTPSANEIKAMQKILGIAADETRLKIMFALIDDSACNCGLEACDCCHCEKHGCMIEKNVTELVNIVKESQSLVSHQLKVLKDADLVSTRRDGTKIYYSLMDGHVKELLMIVREHVNEEVK